MPQFKTKPKGERFTIERLETAAPEAVAAARGEVLAFPNEIGRRPYSISRQEYLAILDRLNVALASAGQQTVTLSMLEGWAGRIRHEDRCDRAARKHGQPGRVSLTPQALRS